MIARRLPVCHGKRLRPEALSVKFAGLDIAEISRLPLKRLRRAASSPMRGPSTREARDRSTRKRRSSCSGSPRTCSRASRCCSISASATSRSSAARRRSRPASCSACGSPRRCAPTCSASSTCSTSRPPACTRPTPRRCSRALDRLKASGNSLFVVEHELDVIRHADWIVDVGPGAGEHGGEILYSGPPDGLAQGRGVADPPPSLRQPRRSRRTGTAQPRGWLRLRGVTRNNLDRLDVAFPLGVVHRVTGVSGSGKSSLVSQVLVELVAERPGPRVAVADEDDRRARSRRRSRHSAGEIVDGHGSAYAARRVDQKPIGRTPRSNLATYTGLFDHVRRAVRRDRSWRAPAATTPADSRSTSPRAAARPARARASSASSCSSCPASTRPARPATGALQRQDARDQATATSASPTCSG